MAKDHQAPTRKPSNSNYTVFINMSDCASDINSTAVLSHVHF